MQFIIKRDILLKSLGFVQGVVEKKNTLPILSNVLIELKNKKLQIIATDLDLIFYDEIEEVKGENLNSIIKVRSPSLQRSNRGSTSSISESKAGMVRILMVKNWGNPV